MGNEVLNWDDLYINTALSFKSNMTKICYCWPSIFSFLLFEKDICISDILRILVCDMAAMPGTLIPFAVRENLRGHSENFTLSKKSERGDIFTEIKNLFHWQKKVVSRN